MLKLRYDVFGAEVLGDVKLVGKYEFPKTEGVRLSSVPDRVVPFDRMNAIRPGDWVHFYVHDRRFVRFLARRERYWETLKSAGGFLAYEFFNRISAGYVKITTIPYRDGGKKGCVATLKDGTKITIRKKSSSDGSPAVDINIVSPGRVKPHKIHFVKEN